MAQVAGNENPFQKQFMRLLSQSWGVHSSILKRISMEVRDIRELLQDLRRPDPVGVGRSTVLGLKANIGKTSMARTPYVTVRGSEPVPAPLPQPKETTMPEEYKKPEGEEDEGPPTAEKEEPKPVKLDAEEINELLDVVHNTADLPSLLPLNQAAMINLTIMAAEVQEELDKRAEEMRKKGEELQAKIVAWKQKKEDQRKKEEKEAKEKADAA